MAFQYFNDVFDVCFRFGVACLEARDGISRFFKKSLKALRFAQRRKS
jgi:hypothetical protein